ncbi:MAG TPA: hypothetical protein DCO82_02400 [Alphaproteobacteria bacterium]|nr:hypothetical protein [Alphaproteobacteria bacterium]
MDDIERATIALKRAHEAGDVEAARKIAQSLKAIQGNEGDLVVAMALGEEPEGPGFLSRAGTAIKDTAKTAYKMAKGPSDLPRLPEFNTDESVRGFGPKLRTSAGMLLAADPEGQANVIRKNLPGVRMFPVRSRETGQEYQIADYTDPETGERQRGYVNAPGLSPLDATQFAAQAALYSPAARATGGAAKRIAKVAGKSGATSVGIDVGAELLGADQGISPQREALAVAGGAVFEGLSPLVAAGWRRVFADRTNYNPWTGELTEKGSDMARRAGLDVNAMDARMKSLFGDYADAGADREILRRTMDAREFNIRQSRAQQTGDFTMANEEERMVRGLMGTEPMRIVRDFRRGQEDDIARAQQGIAGRLSGRDIDGEPAAEAVRRGVTGREAAMRAGVDDAYEAAREAGPIAFAPEATKDISQRIRATLQAQDREVDRMLTPATTRALLRIDEKLGGDVPRSLKEFESTRRVVNSLYDAAANKADRANVQIIRRELDDWLENTVDQALFTGDEAAIAALKKARGTAAEYNRIFSARGRGDKPGAMIEKIIQAETPEQTANYILGASEIGKNPELTVALRRLKQAVGENSEAFGAVREMVWDRLSKAPTGKPLTSDMFDKRLNTALSNNRSVMNEVFSQEEINMMRRYARALKATKVERTNPSGSAFSIESALRTGLQRMGQREAFTKGNVGTGMALRMASRLPLNVAGTTEWAQRMAARRVIEPIAPPVRKMPPGFVGSGTAAGTLSIDRANQ